ncbi:hypothetical protein P171DRAFT_489463 [Karstenula rhodostoma CBS 690.94]|uniref:Uncharacterized protein n=1 Tax=Karstenula rhodostoma CBS 690.94 TaxID=1392251 RepID=A0A9P4P9A7_9PLEO|nr:hypothetical protein P171DRAFT_489463 [Karstenula rhodostoma CBS 690.94]
MTDITKTTEYVRKFAYSIRFTDGLPDVAFKPLALDAYTLSTYHAEQVLDEGANINAAVVIIDRIALQLEPLEWKGLADITPKHIPAVKEWSRQIHDFAQRDAVWVMDFEHFISLSGYAAVPLQGSVRNLTTGKQHTFNIGYNISRGEMMRKYDEADYGPDIWARWKCERILIRQD